MTDQEKLLLIKTELREVMAHVMRRDKQQRQIAERLAVAAERLADSSIRLEGSAWNHEAAAVRQADALEQIARAAQLGALTLSRSGREGKFGMPALAAVEKDVARLDK